MKICFPAESFLCKSNSFSYEKFCTKTRLKTEANDTAREIVTSVSQDARNSLQNRSLKIYFSKATRVCFQLKRNYESCQCPYHLKVVLS